MGCNELIELKFGYDTVGVCSNNLRFFQNFSFNTSPVIELERYRNENNVFFWVLCLIKRLSYVFLQNMTQRTLGGIHFNNQMFLLLYQGSVLPIHEWHEWFIICVQTFDTLLSVNQQHHLFVGSVLVFEKRIICLQITVSTPGKSFFPSFPTRTMPQ